MSIFMLELKNLSFEFVFYIYVYQARWGGTGQERWVGVRGRACSGIMNIVIGRVMDE